MKAIEIANVLDGKILTGNPDTDADAFYAGDFLSRVMGKAPKNAAWLTVMSSVNVAGVAVLAEIAVIIICENVKPSPELVERTNAENIVLIVTEKDVFSCCALIAGKQ